MEKDIPGARAGNSLCKTQGQKFISRVVFVEEM